jgi:O-antigen ligase
MTLLFLALGAVYILLRLMSDAGLSAEAFMPVGAAYSLFWVWLVSLALSQALLNEQLWRGWRVVLIVLVAATFYVAYVQAGEWQSGWLPAAVSVAAILLARWWRLGLLFAVVSIAPLLRLIDKLIEIDNYSYSTRLDAWEIVMQIVKMNPILGLGPANYYWYTPLFPIRGYAVVFNSHSQYIDLIAQTGILGLLCFFWFAGTVGWLGWRLRSRVPAGFAYVYGALGGLVGMLVAAALGDWVLPFVYNVGLTGMRSSLLAWMFLGGLVALEQMTSSTSVSHASSHSSS